MKDDTTTEDAACAAQREARERRNALLDKPPTDWADTEIVEVLTDRYAPSVIPPCRVCGGELSICAIGGGEPTRWACSPTVSDPDPDRSGNVQTKAGRGVNEFGSGGHYSMSQYIDRRQGGDEVVIEVLRRLMSDGSVLCLAKPPLVAAIRAFTVDAPNDEPNGIVEQQIELLGALLDPKKWGHLNIEQRALLKSAHGAMAALCESLADDTKGLCVAAEAYFGGDFRKP